MPAAASAARRFCSHSTEAVAWAAAAADFIRSNCSMRSRSSASEACGSISNKLSNMCQTLHPRTDIDVVQPIAVDNEAARPLLVVTLALTDALLGCP